MSRDLSSERDRWITRRALVACSLLASGVLASVPRTGWAGFLETPFFAQQVASSTLPKVDSRLPAEPAVVDTAGRPGGELRMLMANPKDTRMMVVYGYARLVGLTPSLNLAPDILKAIDV